MSDNKKLFLGQLWQAITTLKDQQSNLWMIFDKTLHSVT